VLGLLCWILTVGFPDRGELNKLDWRVVEHTVKKIDEGDQSNPHLAVFSGNNIKNSTLFFSFLCYNF